MAFSWFFRGFFVALFCLELKTVFGPFSLLFRGFFRGFFVAPVLGKFYAYSPWNSRLKIADASVQVLDLILSYEDYASKIGGSHS